MVEDITRRKSLQDIPLSMRRFLRQYVDSVKVVETVDRVHAARTDNYGILVGTVIVTPDESTLQTIYDAQRQVSKQFSHRNSVVPHFIEGELAEGQTNEYVYPERDAFLDEKDEFREIYRRTPQSQ